MAHSSSIRILLVEDNPAHAELLRHHLAQALPSAMLTVVEDGEDALEILQGHAGYSGMAPDLTLLDLDLPKVAGLDVLRVVKQDEHLRHIPILILTASKSSEDLELANRLQVDGYFNKPESTHGYVRLIEQILEFWHASRLQREQVSLDH